jgi:protein phosphatase-4 regulatory subunit 3
VKTILLLNDPSIIELIVTDELSFEEVCSTLEYDPDLRDKANHRWFLRERAKFRTVALMEDEELIAAIHRSFRVNYLRDTLLRPTMDESSLSTLSSLQTFTHADVVKGVTMSPAGTDDQGELLRDSYLAKIIRILGREQDAICLVEWRDLESLPSGGDIRTVLAKRQEESNSDLSTVVSSGKYPQSQKMSTIWKQHLAPQDNSMSSRRLRRRGSLSFLRELFNMVRISLQQTDKDDFFAVLVSMEVDLTYDQENYTPDGSPSATSRNRKGNESKEKESPKLDGTSSSAMEHSPISSEPVNLLSLLANVLSDPETDVTEKASVLEIVAGIAMHDPSLIRRRCLDFYSSWKRDRKVGNSYQEQAGPTRPNPNEKKQVIFLCPPNDLLASLLFLLATESDAGVLLQASEIMRIILDTDMMGDHAMNTGFADEAEGIPPNGGHKPLHDQHPNPTGTGNTTSTEQNQFLSMFYENYIQWLAAPFQYTILYPLLRIPRSVLVSEKRSHLIDTMLEKFKKGAYQEETLLFKVHFSALRNSFAVELLSFCVRAHQYRMKFFLLRSRVLGNVLKLLKPSSLPRNTSGDRCLKLAVLRFLRAILSVNDEFYHRHIIQHDLFGPVFEAFRANPVGDNLVSSSIVEMCDYINTENIISLMEYIVTKYLSATGAETPLPSLEDVSSPYVSTLTYLRQTYEKLLHERSSKAHTQLADQKSEANSESGCEGHSRYFHDGAMGRSRIVMNEKALEDQRKYREVDQEESYFEADDDENGSDEIEAQEVIDNELHRTPRMFSLAHTPLLSNTYLGLDENKLSDNNSNV